MSERIGLFAYTEPGSEYPQFVNVSIIDGEAVLHVRGPKRPRNTDDNPRPYLMCGHEVTMSLPREQIVDLISGLRRALIETQ